MLEDSSSHVHRGAQDASLNKVEDDKLSRRNQKPFKRTRSRIWRRSSTRVLIPWALSAFLAFSLFTTFTYQPPDLPDKHPHIVHNQIGLAGSILPGTGTSTGSTAQRRTQASAAGGAASSSFSISNAIQRDHVLLNNKQETYLHDTSKRLNQTQADKAFPYGQVDLASLHLPVDATSVVLSDVPENHPMQQNPIMGVLKDASISEISLDDWKALPELAKNVIDLYGPRIVSKADDRPDTGPLVLGMETCEAYRQAVPLEERYVGAAGMFNTGTNALQHHLETNILHVGSVWQVPWGKHRMPYQRLKHVAPGMSQKDQSKCLPVVIVRDPYHWMQSMCKSPYAAHWRHGPRRCPNLFADDQDQNRFQDLGFGVENATSFRVKVIFDKDDVEFFDSLVDLWSGWYGIYLNATYPHLIIRFEDMLLQAPAVLSKVAECVGGEVRKPLVYQQGSAKPHGSHTDFLKAILKSADSEKRKKSLTPKDQEYAVANLDSPLMDAFQYTLLR